MTDAEEPLVSAQERTVLPLSMMQVKLRYGAIMFLVFLIAFIFRAASGSTVIFEKISAMNHDCKGSDQHFCLSSTFTMRLAFSLTVFYGVHLLLSFRYMRVCFGDAAFSVLIQGGFFFKVILLAGFCVASLFMPFDFFIGFGYFAMVASVLFLIMQAVILLDFAYSWNEKWVPEDGYNNDEDESLFKRATLAATFLLFAVAITLVGLSYKWFAPDSCSGSDKSLNLFFITFTLAFGILGTLASAAVDGGSILISSFAFAYCSIMTFSALNSGATGEDCDEIWSDPSKISFNTIMSMMIAAGAVISASVSSTTSRSAFQMNSIETEEGEDGSSFPFFFLCFSLGSCYLAMTLCGWDIVKGSDDINAETRYLAANMGAPSMWAKMATVWFTMILFIWALMAPSMCGPEGICCRDRSFE